MARLKEYRQDMAYRIYVTDALKGVVSAEVRWIDMVKPQEEEKDADEVVNNIKAKLSKLGAS